MLDQTTRVCSTTPNPLGTSITTFRRTSCRYCSVSQSLAQPFGSSEEKDDPRDCHLVGSSVDSTFLWLSAVGLRFAVDTISAEELHVGQELWDLVSFHRGGRRAANQKRAVLKEGLELGVLSNEPPFILDDPWGGLQKSRINWELLAFRVREHQSGQEALVEELEKPENSEPPVYIPYQSNTDQAESSSSSAQPTAKAHVFNPKLSACVRACSGDR